MSSLLPPRIEGPRLEAGVVHWSLAEVRRSLRPAVRGELRGLEETIADDRLLRPVAACRLLPAAVEGCRLCIGGEQAIEGDAIVRLAGATEVAVVFATLGSAWSEAVTASFASGDGLRGFLLDQIGTAAIERVSRRLEALVRLDARSRGRCAGSPLQPGHPGLPMQTQFLLAQLAPIRSAGMEVNPSGMIVPTVSISMILGIGDSPRRWSRAQACRECPSWERCRLRRTPGECA